MKPLKGIRVIDLTHMLAGPYAGMVLADLGAETIKVEPVGTGEMTRTLLVDNPSYSFKGLGAYFLTLNRNKKSVAIDLKSEEGLNVFYDLIQHADIVLNNFSVGVIKKLKIDYNSLIKVNPKIITCSITGFGETGPNSSRPSYDQIAQAYGGGMSITGTNSSQPLRSGIPIGDLGGGLFAVIGILSALISKNSSGKGQHIDISLLDVQISLLNYMATMQTLSGENPEPIGNAHFVHVPYNSFTTLDGFIIIAVITNEFWKALLQVLDINDLNNPDFSEQEGRLKNQSFIEELINKKLSEHSTGHWLKVLSAARIPCAPVNNFSQALSDEQVIHRNMLVEVSHPRGGSVKMPGNPVKMSESPEGNFSSPPLLGEHTFEVLKSIMGYDTKRIESLVKKQVISSS
ncbi:MAG: acyl-CoA transferase [Gammaproteobacteria bacterium]|nr:acyl-CoA transferase [Gammaproteobacteria bacterium]|tara:strand:+ start:93 stop:1298 length:1206 start_codon:yes stop_codon:yes gene_type:complete